MLEAERLKSIEKFRKIHKSLYMRMLDNNDSESKNMLNEMFDAFIDYGGNEFSRGLDAAKQIYLGVEK